MRIVTKNLNQAAALHALGAEIVEIEDGHPQWTFKMKARFWMIWYEKYIGWMPYRRFTTSRSILKEEFFKRHSKNTNFRGKDDGKFFHDVIRVGSFNQAELRHFKI